MYTNWDIRYFIYITSYSQSSLISHSPRHQTILTFVSHVVGPGFRWNVIYIPPVFSGIRTSSFMSTILISVWTQNKFYTGRCCYQQRWLRHPQKQRQQLLICSHGWFTLFNLIVTKFITGWRVTLYQNNMLRIAALQQNNMLRVCCISAWDKLPWASIWCSITGLHKDSLLIEICCRTSNIGIFGKETDCLLRDLLNEISRHST